MNPVLDITQKKTDLWKTFADALADVMPDVNVSSEMKMMARRVFYMSDFVYHQALRDPAQMYALMVRVMKNNAPLILEVSEYIALLNEQCEGNGGDAEMMKGLRQLRNWEMVRIAWNDLTRKTSLQETLQSLSNLADAAVTVALAYVTRKEEERYGAPLATDGRVQEMLVVGMGKLGAYELNFSSDIDLIFTYPTAGQTSGENSITCDEFFAKVGKRLIFLLSEVTEDGFVFRVDMRLRPYGEKGPLVLSFDRMLQYYELMGRDWERYAWVKGRIIVGGAEDAQWIMDRMHSFVYRRYLDYGNFSSLRAMKEKITQETLSGALRDNIKSGPGGIREIEFFGQIFQLVRGGVMPSLQKRAILQVLKVLLEEELVSADVYDDLTCAYIFLRDVENRIQMVGDQQVYTLPADAEGQARLAFSMGFDDWNLFKNRLDLLRKKVNFHFQKLLEPSSEDVVNTGIHSRLVALWATTFDSEEGWEVLAETGYNDPKSIARMIETFRLSPSTQRLSLDGRDRLCQLMPRVIALAGATRYPEAALGRMLDLLDTIERRTCYLYLLIENPLTLKRLVTLASQSSWIISFVARYPALLDEVVDLRGIYEPLRKESVQKLFHKRLEDVPHDDIESQMEIVTLLKQYFLLRVATSDIAQELALMQASDQLSLIAESILDEVLSFTWTYLTEKHGMPFRSICGDEATERDKGFAIVAGGKLGGYELGYTSDLDLIFLHAGDERETVGGARPIDGRQFYTRLGQRLIHELSTPTSAGVMYEVDTRLRPNGSSGVLVSHIDMYEDYQQNDAWVWEHQALVRTRAIAGDPEMMARFEEIRHSVLRRPRDPKKLAAAIYDMRNRLQEEHGSKTVGFDLKNSPGGIMDIEFLIQYLILLHAHQHPVVLSYTDIVRQIHMLYNENILDEKAAYTLRKAYLVFRAMAHRLSLQERPAVVRVKRLEGLRKAVLYYWTRTFLTS